jgi:hypothetical protein
MDIVITRNSFQTLVDIIIVNPTCTNLVQHALMMTMHVTTIATQNKAQSYTQRAPIDDFIPLVIETYDYFHPCFDSFFIFLFRCQYSSPATNFINTFDAYILS